MAATSKAGRREGIADIDGVDIDGVDMDDTDMDDTDMGGDGIGVDDPMSLRSRLAMWQYRSAGRDCGWG
jgi:hypothetical protein